MNIFRDMKSKNSNLKEEIWNKKLIRKCILVKHTEEFLCILEKCWIMADFWLTGLGRWGVFFAFSIDFKYLHWKCIFFPFRLQQSELNMCKCKYHSEPSLETFSGIKPVRSRCCYLKIAQSWHLNSIIGSIL